MSTDEKSLLELLDDLKAALDEQDRLMQPQHFFQRLIRPPCFDDPRVAEQDRLNSLPDPEEEER